MCGIAVTVSDHGRVDPELVRRMCDLMVHRGPDSGGFHVAGAAALGMRRLSIIDLEGGDQPIYSEDGSLAIVFNGEIYNFRELRDELLASGHRFSTLSDTEVVLHLYEERRERALQALRGMFAFAIHERDSGRVFLARDRLGIKPLHYAQIGGGFFAASEMKSIARLPDFPLTLDAEAVDQYFSLLYVPSPRTIFQEIRKLPPAHYLIKDVGRPPVIRRYWELSSRPCPGPTEEEWIEGFRQRFDAAVASHLVADVPLGAFLSGGVDSSGMVASMAKAGGKVKTLSLGFGAADSAFDERRYARMVAQRFGTEHEELVVEPRIEETIRRVARVFDEPMGDSGAVPNFLVCQMARRGVTVALSGLGGDELAGGYQRHLGGMLADWYRKVPRGVREHVIRRLVEALPESRRGSHTLDHAKRFVRHAEQDPVDRFFAFSSPLDRERRAAMYTPALRERLDLDSSRELMRRLAEGQPDADALNKLLCIDLQSYMVDDLLTVADRTSMAVSLEVRVPFLDHELVEFMAGVPGHLKVRGFQKKYLLKKAFEKDVPREVLYRRKAGFSLPVARWLREDLRGLLDEVLCRERLVRDGLFEPSAVESLKRDHLDRKSDCSSALWALMMFHLWADDHLGHGKACPSPS